MSSEALERAMEKLRGERQTIWGQVPMFDQEEAAALLAEVARLEQKCEKALGEDQSGRAFSELLAVAANMLEERGGGPVADCLAAKSADVAAALVNEPAAASFRDQAVKNVDAKFGYTVEFSPNPEAHRDEYASEEGRLRAAAATLAGGGDEGGTATAREPTSGVAPAASAAADEPTECPRCGNETTEADLTYSGCGVCRAEAAAADLVDAAADEPPARRAPPERNPECVECNEDEFYSQPEWAADGVTPCHRVGTAAIKCPVPAVYTPAADEPRLLVGKHPKTDGATFALDAEARCACGDLIDDHPTMACGFPRAPAADEPGERVAACIVAMKVGWDARPDEALSRDESMCRQAQRNIVELIEDALAADEPGETP